MEIITQPPSRALVVTPHPDDAEGGCGATMAKWVQEAGTEIVVVMCTNGDKGTSDREMAPEQLAATRQQEQRDASGVLGVQGVVFLEYPDGTSPRERDAIDPGHPLLICARVKKPPNWHTVRPTYKEPIYVPDSEPARLSDRTGHYGDAYQ